MRLGTRVADAFADEGPLARALPSFEPRPSQLEMATAAGDIFTDGGILLAEAGTGTGKTLAYLVPAIFSRHRVLISTGTKNLQDQIYVRSMRATEPRRPWRVEPGDPTRLRVPPRRGPAPGHGAIPP